MSRENVELAEQALEAFNTGGLSAIAEFWDPEIVWHTDPLVPEPGSYEGKEMVLTYLQGWLRAFTEARFEINDIRAVGSDEVLAEATMLGQPVGGAEGDTHFLNWCLIAQVRDGLWVRIRSFLDRDRALEAVGLSE